MSAIPLPNVAPALAGPIPEPQILPSRAEMPDATTQAPAAYEPESSDSGAALREMLISLEFAAHGVEEHIGAAARRHFDALTWLRDGHSATASVGSWWRRLIRRWLIRPWHAISGREGRALAAALLDVQAAAEKQAALQLTLTRRALDYAEVAQADAQARATARATARADQIAAQQRMAVRFASDTQALRDELAQLAADARARYADSAAVDARLAEAITSEGALLRGALSELSREARLSADHLRALELMALYDYH